jgi:hypothetical protein
VISWFSKLAFKCNLCRYTVAHHAELAACSATATALQLAGMHPARVRVDAAALRLLAARTSPAHAAALAAPLARGLALSEHHQHSPAAAAAAAAAAATASAAAAVVAALEDALAASDGQTVGGDGGGAVGMDGTDPESEVLAMRARSAAWVLASALRRRHGLEEGAGEGLLDRQSSKYDTSTAAPAAAAPGGINRRWAAELGARGDWITLLGEVGLYKLNLLTLSLKVPGFNS